MKSTVRQILLQSSFVFGAMAFCLAPVMAGHHHEDHKDEPKKEEKHDGKGTQPAPAGEKKNREAVGGASGHENGAPRADRSGPGATRSFGAGGDKAGRANPGGGRQFGADKAAGKADRNAPGGAHQFGAGGDKAADRKNSGPDSRSFGGDAKGHDRSAPGRGETDHTDRAGPGAGGPGVRGHADAGPGHGPVGRPGFGGPGAVGGHDPAFGFQRAHDGPAYMYHGRKFSPFRVPPYAWPHGFSYHRFGPGQQVPHAFLGEDFFILNFLDFGIDPPPPGFVWLRYGPDLILVDRFTGEVVQIAYGAFIE